jgi:hypothetical protein
MAMKKRPAVVLGALLITASGAAALATASVRARDAYAVSDPRQETPIVRLATAAQVTGSERGFTGIIGARVQSNLGFRVAGKIVERVDADRRNRPSPCAVFGIELDLLGFRETGHGGRCTQSLREIHQRALRHIHQRDESAEGGSGYNEPFEQRHGIDASLSGMIRIGRAPRNA